MIHQSELPPQATVSTGHYVADHAGYYWQAYTRRNQALGNGCRVFKVVQKHSFLSNWKIDGRHKIVQKFTVNTDWKSPS